MNRRSSLLLGVVTTTVAAVVALGVVFAPLALAQTTPTTPTTVSPPTTSPAPATTLPAETTTTPTEPTTTTTAPAAATDSDDDTPWWIIGVVIVLLVAIISGFIAWSRRRGQHQQALLDWQQRAARAASEAGATARLLAAGTPADAGIVQQLHGSVQTFEGLLGSAPDEATRASAQQAAAAVGELGIAVDAEASARSAQPPFSPAQLAAAAAAGLQQAASDTDRALAPLYNRHRPRRRS